VWLPGSRVGRSRPGWGGHRRRCRGSWPETAAAHRYRAQTADAAAFSRAQRPKPAKLVLEPRLRAVVEAKLALRWSPQQIAGWLELTRLGGHPR
jgi:IS30 family transposase